MVLENTDITQAKILEICTEEQDENNLLAPVMQASLDDTPSIEQDITVLTPKTIDLPGISIRNNQLKAESQCLILIVKSLLETTDV